MKLLTAAIILILFSRLYSQENILDTTTIKDTVIVSPNPLKDTMQDTIATKDTVGILPEIILPAVNTISIKPFFNNSFFINKRFIERASYNHAGEILKFPPFYQVINLGSSGQFNQLYAYGSSSYNILEDGIPVLNAFGIQAMNLIHTEDVDSLEIVQSTQSFFVGEGPAINVLSKDFTSETPYTRIKYYEGAEEEGFVDGIFNALIYRKLNMFVNLTNKKVDDSYTNTDHNYWQARIKLKYFLSDNINILATYGYAQFHRGFNGGVRPDSLGVIDNETLFNEDLAQVYYQNQSEGILNHRLAAKVLFEPNKNYHTDLSLYYHFLRNEFNFIADRQNNFRHQKSKTAGVILKQVFTFSKFNAVLMGNYFNNNTNLKMYEIYASPQGSYSIDYPVDERYKFSALLNLNFIDSTLIPSVYLSYGNDERSGIGAELKYILLNKVHLNFGAATYGIDRSNQFTNYEAGISYRNERDYLYLKYFSSEGGTYASYFINHQMFNNPNFDTFRDLSGFSLSFSNHISKILLEGAANYYINNINSPIFLSGGQSYYYVNLLPELNINAGIYYTDILFDRNLDLKAGVELNYYADEKNTNYSKIFTTDIQISGKIQDAAVVFFTWENILDKRYYTIPYYPVRGRNIRFGVSWELFN